MAGLDDILKMVPIADIAAKLGVEPAVATRAVQEGGAAILGGLQHNAKTPDGSAAIQQALGAHAGAADGQSVDLGAVDAADGQKILGHIFGGDEDQVAQKLTDAPQTAGIDFATLLPVLAPIVMGLIAKKASAASGAESAAGAEAAGGSGGIGGLIGGLLGGGSGGSGGGGGLDIGGLLGGFLGGKK